MHFVTLVRIVKGLKSGLIICQVFWQTNESNNCQYIAGNIYGPKRIN